MHYNFSYPRNQHKYSNVCVHPIIPSIVMIFKLQDGSYSRGPIDIPLSEFDDTEYYITPIYKFEQVSSACFLQNFICITPLPVPVLIRIDHASCIYNYFISFFYMNWSCLPQI